MAKEINIADAKKWSAEEAEFNIQYLRDRERFDEADKIAELRGDFKTMEEETDWSSLSNEDLKTELELRGLSTEGKKADFVARLEDADREGQGKPQGQ